MGAQSLDLLEHIPKETGSMIVGIMAYSGNMRSKAEAGYLLEFSIKFMGCFSFFMTAAQQACVVCVRPCKPVRGPIGE
jgi:hypothetical protein